MAIRDIPKAIRSTYEIHEWKHASAVLKNDFPNEWNDIFKILSNFYVYKSQILAPGGGISPISKVFNDVFCSKGWCEKSFDTKIVVDETTMESPTHKVDCFKNGIALEVEWNNKDPFFDRDLNNFRLLFELRAISVGIIITKSDELSELFKSYGTEVWSKYGWSTTWMKKLLPRIEGGGGGGCPILAFGITKKRCKGD
ncbi:MAG: restriction endonuclease [Elusimicrobia bacterium RIFCSPLOWO2_01_FULL_54_10]|nr:MAG: restriction endonuclease [Elusimicrobia bacterium RIFCSPLOWO2_01_FULL_54_10]